MNELVEVEKTTLLQAFSSENGLKSVIEDARQIVFEYKHDLSTAAGRKKTASLAAKVSKLKVRLDEIGKELVSEWKAKSKAVDKNRKQMRDELDRLRDEARKPLTDWENAEKKRIEEHKFRIDSMCLSRLTENPDSTEIKLFIAEIEAVKIDESFEEFEGEAAKVKMLSLEHLNKMLVDQLKLEDQQKELERLKKEAEERERIEREEAIKREAAEKARREAEEAARLEREKIEVAKIEAETRAKLEKERAEKAERDRIAAEERAKIEAEQAEKRRIEAEEKAKRDAEAARIKAEQEAREAAELARAKEIERQRAEQARIKAEQEARESNRKHVSAVRKAAKEALIKCAQITEEQAKLIVLSIDKGNIPSVEIKY